VVTSSTPLGGAPPASSGVAQPAGGASCFGFCAARAFEEGAAEIGVGRAEAFAASFAFAVAVGAGVARVDDGSFAPALFVPLPDAFAEEGRGEPFAGDAFAALEEVRVFALAAVPEDFVFAAAPEVFVGAFAFAEEGFAARFAEDDEALAAEVAGLLFAGDAFAVLFAEDDEPLPLAAEVVALVFAGDDEALLALLFAASLAFAVVVVPRPLDDLRAGAVFAFSRAAAATF
jgi:hypothetical protein